MIDNDNDKEKKDNESVVPTEDDRVEHTKEYYDRDRNRAWKNLR
jgi:hypothetical protein